jgi:TET-Associated Glycosyltransferase
MIDYKIVIASKGRPQNVAKCLELFPDASICVDEREEAEYVAVTPAENLVLHSPTKTLGEVRNWVLDNYKEKCIVHMDDDLEFVVAKMGKSGRKIKDPLAIIRLIENMVILCNDLDLELFAFTKQSPFYPTNPIKPFKFATFPYGLVGQVGRRHRWADHMEQSSDVDLVYQYMTTSRILLSDNRYFFKFGSGVSRGGGGLQGMRSEEGWAKSKRYLKRRWGIYYKSAVTNRGVYAAYNMVKRQRDTPTK